MFFQELDPQWIVSHLSEIVEVCSLPLVLAQLRISYKLLPGPVTSVDLFNREEKNHLKIGWDYSST